MQEKRALKRTTGKIKIRNILCDFTERTPFLSEVYAYANASTLCAAHALFDGEYEIWLAGADIRAEDIGAIALDETKSRSVPQACKN